MTQVQTLFEAKDRKDSRPCRHGESILDFLDRVGPSAFWDDVRAVLNDWLSRHPDPNSLCQRFQTEFDAMFWELYVHEVFRRLGYHAQVEREGTQNRPDFTFTKDGETLIVECWSSSSAGFDRTLEMRNGSLEFVEYNEEPVRRLAQELDDRITSPDLCVCLDDLVADDNHPSFRRLCGKVQAWIDSSPRPEQVAQFTDAGWSFTLTATPKCSDEPFVAVFPSVSPDLRHGQWLGRG